MSGKSVAQLMVAMVAAVIGVVCVHAKTIELEYGQDGRVHLHIIN